jgi:hypothetical protein
MRGYATFHPQTRFHLPTRRCWQALLALSRALLADPEREGLQLIAHARSDRRFNRFLESWQILNGGCIAVLTDLFISEAAPGAGVADALIHACADECALAGLADWCENQEQ